MNSISIPSSSPYLALSFASKNQIKKPMPHFGNNDPLSEAKKEASSMFSDMFAEVKRYFTEFIQGVSGKFQTAFIGGKNAFKVFSQGLSISDTLNTANPESTFESRIRSLGTLAYAEFYDTLLQIEEAPSIESKSLLFLLYDSVLQEFPALLKTPEFPKLREKALILRLLETHPAPDETKEELLQILINPESQEKLAKLSPRQIKEVAEALADANPEQVQEKIDVEAEVIVVDVAEEIETEEAEVADLKDKDEKE